MMTNRYGIQVYKTSLTLISVCCVTRVRNAPTIYCFHVSVFLPIYSLVQIQTGNARISHWYITWWWCPPPIQVILAKTCLAAVTWHIWRERNARIFQLKEQNKVMIFRGLYEDIRLLLRTYNWKTDKKSSMEAILLNWNVWLLVSN